MAGSYQNIVLQVSVVVGGTPVQAPFQRVAPGEACYIKPIPGNVGTVFVGHYAAEAVSGVTRLPVANNDIEREFPVTDVSQIWINGANANDGLIIVVRKSLTEQVVVPPNSGAASSSSSSSSSSSNNSGGRPGGNVY